MLTVEFLKRTFIRMPNLHTERLLLRQILPTDAEAMYDYASKKEVTRYLLWSPHPTKDYTARYIDYLQEKYRSGEFYDWAIVPQECGFMIGTCGFTRFNTSDNSAEIGYVLNPSAWGHGYAAEAVKRVLSFAFQELGLHRVEARYLDGNQASRRTMERVGMTFEGVMRDAMIVKGRYQSVGICSILRDEYFGQK